MFYDSISIRNRHLIPPSKRWDDSRTRAKGSGIRKQVIIERMWLCAPSSIQASMGCISTNAFQLIICIISGVCCLLPLAISPKSYLEGSLLRASLTAQLHRESAIAVVTLIVPLLLDITTDILSSFFTKARDAEVKKKSKLALLNNMEHLVFLCGTVVIPITAFIPSSNDNWAYIYISCRQCQLVLTGGAITISLCRYDEKYWPVRATYLVLVCLLIASTIGAFSNNYLLENPPSNTVQALQSTSYYIFLIAAVIFTCCSLRWLWATVPKLMPRSDCFSSVVAKHTSKERGTTSDISKQSYLFPVVYVVTSVSICPVLFLLSNIYSNCLNYDIRALFFHNLIFFVYLLLITYGSTRMMKYEIVKGLVSNFDRSFNQLNDVILYYMIWYTTISI